jgi:hypothetical protein
MSKTLRTSGDYTIKAGDGWNSGSGVNAITLDSLNVSVSGNLTVGGSSTTVNTTNTTIEDNIIELNSGLSQSLNDSGIIIERGSTGDNAAIVWDESGDIFKLGTTTSTGADKSGGITVTAGALEVAAFTATTGTFSGAITATTGTFSGAMTSVGGTVTGSLTAGSLTTNVISANGSNAELSIQPSGTGNVVLGALTINGTAISSADSSLIQLNEAVNISGATDIGGALTIGGSLDFGSAILSNGTVTHAGSSGQQPLDEFVHATYRSAKYIVSITDATNTKYEMVELYITHDGTNAYITSQGVKSTSAGTLAVFAADISGSNVRVLILPSSSESVTYKFLRTLVVV